MARRAELHAREHGPCCAVPDEDGAHGRTRTKDPCRPHVLVIARSEVRGDLHLDAVTGPSVGMRSVFIVCSFSLTFIARLRESNRDANPVVRLDRIAP
jgi:hypothetical protein